MKTIRKLIKIIRKHAKLDFSSTDVSKIRLFHPGWVKYSMFHPGFFKCSISSSQMPSNIRLSFPDASNVQNFPPACIEYSISPSRMHRIFDVVRPGCVIYTLFLYWVRHMFNSSATDASNIRLLRSESLEYSISPSRMCQTFGLSVQDA